jgi:hypothetical protein
MEWILPRYLTSAPCAYDSMVKFENTVSRAKFNEARLRNFQHDQTDILCCLKPSGAKAGVSRTDHMGGLEGRSRGAGRTDSQSLDNQSGKDYA